jgi:hypothetical protein
MFRLASLFAILVFGCKSSENPQQELEKSVDNSYTDSASGSIDEITSGVLEGPAQAATEPTASHAEEEKVDTPDATNQEQSIQIESWGEETEAPNDLNEVELGGLSLDAETEMFDLSSHSSPLNTLMDSALGSDMIAELERESAGKYRSTEDRLKACRAIPISYVWREFSPFFGYRWDAEFQEFAALFLTMWKRESNFAPPKLGVIVQPNCKKKPAKVIKGLPGKNVKTDLALTKVKDKKVSSLFKGCSLKSVDYGALQWNYHWRLKRSFYRSQLERSLLLASSYKSSEIKLLSNVELASLVKYNPTALFILGGLELKREAKTPEKAIREYNTDRKYHKMALKNFHSYTHTLRNRSECFPVWRTGKKS